MEIDIESEDFQAYLENFNRICDNPEDNEIAMGLMEKAKNSDPDDFKLFLEYNLYILQNPPQQSAPYYASIFIMNSFRETNFDEIKEKWNSESVIEIHENVQSIIMENIQHDDESTRNVCATILSLIAILEGSWPDLCEVLFDNIRTQDQNFNLTAGSIRCLAEIFSFPLLNDMSEFPDFLRNLVATLAYEFGDQSLPPSTRVDACRAYSEISNQLPFNYDSEMMDIAIQNISQSLMVNDENLYLNSFRLLQDLAIKNYETLNQNDSHTILTIHEIIHNEIMNKRGYPKCIAIYFLIKFAKFEKVKPDSNYGFSCGAASEFVDQLLQCLIDIEDPQNQDPENPLDTTTHLTAANALQALFYHNTQVIFMKVKEFFDQHIESQNWIEAHAAIYSIYALCIDPSESSNEISFDTVREYMMTILPSIIAHAGENAMCLRTKETAMWIIPIILETYQIIDEDNENEVTQLLTLFESTMDLEYPPSIIIRSCKIFADVARTCNKFYLDSNFQKIVEIILTVVQNFQPENKNDFYKPFAALDALIKNCTDNCNEQISDLLNEFIEILSNGNYSPPHVSPMTITITAIILRIPSIVSQMAESLIMPFISLIDVTTKPPQNFKQDEVEFDTDIWENVMIILLHLVRFGGASNEGIVILIINSIFNAFSIVSLNLVKNSLRCLGQLYACTPSQYLVDYLDSTIEIISYLITVDFDEDSFSLISSIIYVYAEIFQKMGSAYIDFQKNQYQEILESIDKAWRTEFDSATPNDLVYLYANIAHAYKCLILGFAKNKQFLVFHCRAHIFKFLEMIYNEKIFEELLLDQIYNLLKVVAETLKTRINVLINRKYVLGLVEAGLEFPRIEEKANYLLKLIPEM